VTTKIDLAALLSPTSAQDFVQSHWAKAPLMVRAPARDRFDGVLDLAAFEFLLTTVAAPGWLSIVSGGEIKPPVRDQLTLDGTPNLTAIMRAVSEKKSLLLLNVNRLDRGVGALCRQVESDFRALGLVLGKPVRANAYFTPPRAQGLEPHYDDHDVLVLQLHGSKRWRLHGEAVKWPRKPMVDALPREFVKAVPDEVTLAPGDLLYLPRGFVHEAASMETSSLHLTLSVQPATWANVFERLIEQEASLGEALPVGFCAGGAPRAGDEAALLRIAGGMGQWPGVSRAMGEIFNRTLLEGDMPANGQLARIGSDTTVKPDAWLVLAAGLAAQLEREGNVPVLRVPGAAYRSDPRAAAFFGAVCAGTPFRLCDIDAGANLEPLTELARQFISRGILVAGAKQP
jgi:hypothetical protein